jgi:hypothetical protein
MPALPPMHPEATTMEIDLADIIDEDAIIEDEEEEEEEADDNVGRSQKYADGLINRPLTEKQAQLLQSLYKRIGKTLYEIASHLWNKRKDDMQAFIELSGVISPV